MDITTIPPFTPRTAWEDWQNLSGVELSGVYLFGRKAHTPQARPAQPLDENTLYVGMTVSQRGLRRHPLAAAPGVEAA